MGLFNKNRKDAKWIKPKDGVAAIMPYIMNKRADAEVSSQLVIDVTNLCNFVDNQNKKGNLEHKMTYFHALTACLGMTIFNREALNRFVKNKRLYQRNKITFAYEFLSGIFASMVSVLGGLLLKHVDIQDGFIIVGLLGLLFMTLFSDYMRKRFGLKPDEYNKEDIDFN